MPGPPRPRNPTLTALLAVLASVQLALACVLSEPAARERRAAEVVRVAVDPGSGAPVVILREINGLRRQLPIWIGVYEARSIALGLKGVTVPRPNPHDLIHDMIRELGGKLERVVVTELRDSVYYAVIDVLVDGRVVQLDARPSDAIAVALRFSAPLYIDEAVLDRGAGEDEDNPRTDV